MSTRPDPTDLVALDRRGLLSESEEQELAAALGGDPDVTVLHTVGNAVDEDTRIRAGDDDVIARAAEEALVRVRKSGLVAESRPSGFRFAREPRKRRGIAALLAAALVLFTGAAFAIWSGKIPVKWWPHRTETVQTEAVVVHPSAPRTASAPAPAPEEKPASVERLDEGATDERQPASRTSATPDAASLFRAANAARRDGAFDRAKKLYGELVAKYPSSDEASLARVSLGKLALTTGDAKEAEKEFDQYLKAGHGQLAEEALVSRAESLKRLGRTDAEKQTWQRLLAEHPNSVYAAEAKRRLAELRTGASAAP